MRISDWSSDVCSSDLLALGAGLRHAHGFLNQRVVQNDVGTHAIHLRVCIVRDGAPECQSLCVEPNQPTPSAGLAEYHSRTRSRSEEHTSELQSLMRISYAVFCLKKKKQ